MKKLIKSIDLSDFLILFGLIGFGAGLYLWFGLGPALTITGFLVLLIGILGTRK